MKIASTPLAAFALLVCLGGCSSAAATGGGGGAGGSGAPPDACETYAAARCDALQRCRPVSVSKAYGNPAGCATRVRLECEAELAAPGVVKEGLLACATKLKAAACNQLPETLTACQEIPGTLVAGAACGAGTQCASGFCDTQGGACGVCSARIPIGGACSDIASKGCPDGAYCDPTALKCTAFAALGNACQDGVECGPHGYCDLKCKPIMEVGTPCGPPFGCALDPDLYCDPTTNTCALQGIAGPGQACGMIGSELVLCALGNCPNAMSSCVPLVADGTTCQHPYECQPPATCLSNLCAVPQPKDCK